jgi:hypothetical protein
MSRDELLLADALEALLAAGAGVADGADDAARRALPPDEVALATELLVLAHAIHPEPAFADALEAELRARVATQPDSRTTADEATQGNTAPPPIGGRRSSPRHPGAVQAPPHVRFRAPHRLSPRLPAWVAAAVLLLAALLLVPPVQAGVQAVIQIGVDHIFRTAPVRTPGISTPTPLASVLDLAGETTLPQARAQIGFPIRLPAYPADLGPPQRVFVQDLGGKAVILVWLDPRRPDTVRMSLHELSDGAFVYKIAPQSVQETTVHGQRALWTEGPYFVEVLQDGQPTYAERRLVDGHVLIWTEGSITYRLETSVTLEEAVRIAESLR